MAVIGIIRTYDSGRKAGTIAPLDGGELVTFDRAQVTPAGPEPHPNERYSFEMRYPDDGGRPRAVNLRRVNDAAQPAPRSYAMSTR